MERSNHAAKIQPSENFTTREQFHRPFAGRVPDGNLHILLNNVVIDENGKVACFNYSGIRYRGKDGTSRVLDDRNLVPKIEKLMADTPPIRPATLNGNKVPSRLKTSVSDYKLEVRDHIITYNLETPQKVPLK